jgi:hypothetical protein
MHRGCALAGGAFDAVFGFAWDKYDKHKVSCMPGTQGPWILVFRVDISAGAKRARTSYHTSAAVFAITSIYNTFAEANDTPAIL